MKKKKVNPRKVPATKADVERAKEKARDEALTLAWSILFTVLRDKEGYEGEDLKRAWLEVEYLSDSIIKGYVNCADLRNALKEEEGICLD